MVRSKDVPRKPRDSLLTPPSKLRGAGFLDEGRRPINRGSAAVSPAPASVPNYMRGTSSSDAKGVSRRGARLAATAVPASASPARLLRTTTASVPASASPARLLRTTTAAVRVMPRGKVLFPEPEATPGSAAPGLGRATCSSTLKGARFPDALDLAPGATDAEGPAAMRVCPYTFCSLNGHAHAPAVPLRSFLASRRRLIKTQQSMKLKGVSAFRKKSGEKNNDAVAAAAVKVAPLIDEEALGDYFVEVYAGPRVSSDMSCSDMSVDEMDDATVRKMEFVVFDRCGADEDGEKGEELVFCGDGDGRLEEKQGACRESSSVCSDPVISGEFIEELPWMRYHGSEYDSLDDGISEEQRVRDDEIHRAQISEVQEDEIAQISEEQEDEIDRAQISEEQEEGNGYEGTSGRPADECEQKIAEDLEANDADNISNLMLGSEAAEEHESVEACHKLDGRNEDNILERSSGQAEEEFSEAVDKSEIPDQEASGTVDGTILEEKCIEESLADQGEKDAVSIVKSDDGSEITRDEGSEMENSENFSEITPDAVSNRCSEDFSEEVTSVADECFANDVFEQDGNTKNIQSDAQKELGIAERETENISDGSEIVCNIVDGMEDAQKEMDVTMSEFEESGTANENNPESLQHISSFDDDAQTEPKITTCMPRDASVESDVSQGSSLDGNTEYVADGAMGPETTRFQLKGAYKNTAIDQEAADDDDSVHDAQNDEVKQIDNSANVGSDTQNESDCTTSELALSINEDTENVSEFTKCQPEDASEESGIDQESDHDGCSAYITDATPNESEFMTFESEDAEEDSNVFKEDEGKDNSADSQKKMENTACASGGASEKIAMSQEPDGLVDSAASSHNAQKDIAIQKLDASEESIQLFNVEIPEPKDDCKAEGHESQTMAAEVTEAKEPSVDDICDAFSGMNLKGDVYFDVDDSPTCPRNKLIISRRRRTPEEEEYMRGFNPRAPNFLPLELDPDAEKVDLRHQDVDERKNAEEWMIDYALRRAVTNLTPARKKKVELLVQAFETVLPHDKDEKKSVTPPRPVQACN